jgi:Domain of unknown function (DUF5666)
MCTGRRTAFTVSLLLALCAYAPSGWCYGRSSPQQGSQQPATPGQVVRSVGTVKAINGSTITLAPDAGSSEIDVMVQDSTRLVRIPLGETSLKNATPVQLQDLQAGDRVLVAGKLAEDSKSVNASTIVVMKQSDVDAKHEHDREDWQKRGLGGLVSAVDPAAGTLTISQPSLGSKLITIHTAKSTMVRRYAPDSIKFEDAKPATLADVKPGDQLRARGARSADGTELAAEEIVSGTFRNLAGTVIAIDSAANTLTVLDLADKKPVLVRLTAESQLRKLPAPLAQRIALRLKGGAGGAPASSAAEPVPAKPDAPAAASAPNPSGGTGEHPHANGAPDLQQMLARMPAVTVADLQKGDAVMIVSTEGTASGGVTAIQLVAGVEPILQASPKGGQGMILSPWSLGGGGGGDAESQ